VISVRITDDGRGIDPDVMKLLLLPAFRRTGPEGRAGMGLFLSHQIVEKHGGRLLVASEAGRGTSVTIKLPRNGSLGVASTP
jgi:signal transduction histidine kinase